MKSPLELAKENFIKSANQLILTGIAVATIGMIMMFIITFAFNYISWIVMLSSSLMMCAGWFLVGRAIEGLEYIKRG